MSQTENASLNKECFVEKFYKVLVCVEMCKFVRKFANMQKLSGVQWIEKYR